MSITEDGSVLVAAGKEIVFVSLATGTRKRVGELNSPVAASALSSRFGFLCVVDVNKHLHFADLKTRNLLSAITLPFSPMRFLYIDDKRGRVYVPMWDDKSLTSFLSVVDLTKRSLIATVSLRPGLLGMLCVEGDQVWVSMLDRILLLDPDTLEYQDEIHTGMYPFSLHFRPSISINKSN
ncbi:YncE family protein [Neobacillus sp. BF23-41]|uniref:YncE family protein n=1 Tax=Neobacillus sp. BF23-41 TaxID=3240280 RepID=UPI0034E57B68